MTGTSPAATTLTPESSEQPRETREGVSLVERFDGLAAIQPQGLNDKTVGELQRIAGKVSSPELASLAAKYVNMSEYDFSNLSQPVTVKHMAEWRAFLADVRSLAASVLAQAEGSPRK
jgi:hypothetical protein